MHKFDFYMRDNSYFYAFILVFLAGFLWSLGTVVVLHMIDGHSYVFNYLFYRGISIAVILVCYLIIREGLDFYKNFFKIGIPGILGGIFLILIFSFFYQKLRILILYVSEI